MADDRLMDVAAIPAWAAVFLASGLALRAIVGIWVLRRAIVIRGRAEILIGSFVTLLAFGELCAVAATRLRGGEHDGLVPVLGAAAVVGILLATVAQAEGLRRLFRAGNTALLALIATASLGLIAVAWQRLTGEGTVVVAQPGLANLSILAVSVLLDGWWAGESWLIARRLRRQYALGIHTDATAARRFDAWIVAALAHAALAGSLLVCAAVVQRPAVEFPLLLCFVGLMGSVSALAICVSFHLPAGRRASQPAESAG